MAIYAQSVPVRRPPRPRAVRRRYVVAPPASAWSIPTSVGYGYLRQSPSTPRQQPFAQISWSLKTRVIYLWIPQDIGAAVGRAGGFTFCLVIRRHRRCRHRRLGDGCCIVSLFSFTCILFNNSNNAKYPLYILSTTSCPPLLISSSPVLSLLLRPTNLRLRIISISLPFTVLFLQLRHPVIIW